MIKILWPSNLGKAVMSGVKDDDDVPLILFECARPIESG